MKPQQNTVKITVDASIFEDKNATGIGVLPRSHTGELIRAKTKVFSKVLHPSMAESLAMKEALSWLKDMKWTDTIVELESIRSTIRMRSTFGLVIEECRRMLKKLNNIELYFIKQYANRSAHELACLSHIYHVSLMGLKIV